MKKIASYFGGSKAYGLYQEGISDLDERNLFVNSEISTILGLNRHDHQNSLSEKEDIQGFELRHFFSLLRKGNTQAQELLFNEDWVSKSESFDKIQSNKWKLIDSERIFKCLLGYIQGEKHIIAGTGHKNGLGKKRRDQLKEFGYSFRNCVHALRLARTGIIFFNENRYAINIVTEDKQYGSLIRDVKINPQKYKYEELILIIEELEADLKDAYNNKSVNYRFDEKIANQLCYDIYMPILKVF